MQAFFRSVFFLPTACSYVVAALIWKMSIFSGVRSGAANALLGLIGQDSIPWLSVTKPPWYWLVIVSARLWLQVGFYMILFLAALAPSMAPAPGNPSATSRCPNCGRRRRPSCCCY